MILCVKKDKLPTSSIVNKDINMEDILKDHKYYESEERALQDNYIPLNIMISIRSLYSNLVLEKDVKDTDEKRYYINMTNLCPTHHKGYDLVMYFCSIGVMNQVNYKQGFDDIMMKTAFHPIGLFNPDTGFINPTLYCHILLADEITEEFSKYLKDDVRLVPIKDMNKEGNLTAILDKIIEVEEKSNESDNN